MEAKTISFYRLKNDFFHEPVIKFLESQEDGKGCVLFYIKLLCESLSDGGTLRVSEKMPFDNNSLAVITQTTPDDVARYMAILSYLGLVETLSDKTIIVRKIAVERQRNSPEYKEWRASVFARDDYTCQMCGSRGKEIHAHHVLPWATSPATRYRVDNGLTLCADCHRKWHKENGR